MKQISLIPENTPNMNADTHKIKILEDLLGNLSGPTLDPENWQELHHLANKMVADMLEHLATIAQKPCWQKAPESVKTRIKTESCPLQPTHPESVYNDFKELILPYPIGNIHPRFWGWVNGTGTPYSMLADMLASAINTHMGGFDQTPALVEEQVLSWLINMLALPKQTSGLLVSGATMASIIALTVARNSKADIDVRKLGVQALKSPMVLYCSTETHSSLQKAVELLGLGADALRKIPVDSHYRMDINLLQQAIDADKSSGLKPFCVIGTAGTTGTGATDPLKEIAQICKKEDLWFHLDGAYGVLAALTDKYAHLVAGYELADSIAFDLHKWMYMPFEIGCVFIKDKTLHHAAFAIEPNYLTTIPGGVGAEPMSFYNKGIELTRSFRALKVWISLKIYGAKQFSILIERNINQAQYLAYKIQQYDRLELLAPAELNVVCFRYIGNRIKVERVNQLNQDILIAIQERGIAVPSHNYINGQFAIRVCITNQRSQKKDFDIFLEKILQIGKEFNYE